MVQPHQPGIEAVVVDEVVGLSLADLSQACRVERGRLIALIEEGVLRPEGDDPGQWRFDGQALSRLRTALRLARDLDLDDSSIALVLVLLDEIAELRSRLRRAGIA